MKKLIFLILTGIMISMALTAQPLLKREKYDISKEKVLYTVGYSHLDTEWNWDYTTTINEYIKNTMEENFYLFEKYPDYVFNFTGSYRYRMMKEYYPELYKKVKQYVNQGRWYVSGSSVDEGEVNVSSSESIIRQVLYGNNFFKQEFGTESKDYMLPDCFGFLANMPTIWNHCGLLGFSTQKLKMKSASGIPFNVGVWNGPDGKGIIAALNVLTYTGKVVSRLDLDSSWNARIDTNIKKNDMSFDYRYYGVGDRGGAPRERDVKNSIGSLRNSDSKFKVVLTSSDQMFIDITPELRAKLPVYSGDLLLTEHSAGSTTSQAYMKRANRKNELLAQTAEQTASIADWMGKTTYPSAKLNNAWELVLASQFHDILPGTSIPKAYEYAWNNEFIAGNGFAEVLKHSVSAISSGLNTQTKGRALVVYNPVAIAREDIVTAELEYAKLPANIKVFDEKGLECAVQILRIKENKLKFIFQAILPSVGFAVFDVREASEKSAQNSSFAVSTEMLENEFYKISIASNGDITSIFDKIMTKELLSKPARLEFLTEKPNIYPAWNMFWYDRKNPPIDYLDKEATFKIVEQGPLRIAIEVKRKGMNSDISQIISLSTGEAGKRIEIANNIDWQSTGVSLKASFPLTADNEMATYNMGVGAIQRNNNNEKKFEVPSKEWFDLTDKSGDFGVSILEDCKFGSDKPDNNTLRLTLLFTPETKTLKDHKEQDSQDWGIHDFTYSIYSHKGDWVEGLTPWQGKFVNQPLLAFEAPKHNGTLGKSYSLMSINSPQVGLMAFKKMENGDYYIIRVNELYGKDVKGIDITFPGKIIDAYEVNGQEQKIATADFANGKLNFDISHFTIRSFAVKFASSTNNINKLAQTPVTIPYNQDGMSFDNNRSDGNLGSRFTLPAELIPGEVISEDIVFKMGNTADEQYNMVSCKGQKIDLPAGKYNKLYLLAGSTKDTIADFMIDKQSNQLAIQNITGYIGQFYNRLFALNEITVTAIEKPYLKTDNIAWFASHRHLEYPSKNDAYQYCFMYKYEIVLPEGAKSITLPKDDRIKVFAITVAKNELDNIKVLQPLVDDFKDSKAFLLR